MDNQKVGNPMALLAAKDVLDNTETSTKNILIGGTLLIAAGTIVYGMVQVSKLKKSLSDTADGLLEKLGVKESDIDKYNNNKGSELAANAFDPNYYLKVGKVYIWTPEGAQVYADKIKKAWGLFDDDESSIYGVLRSQKSKAHLSQVSHYYFKSYGVDLLTDLKSRLSAKEFAGAIAIVDPLPNFNKA